MNQLTLLPEPPFFPLMPAAVKELHYLGWEPISTRVHTPSRRRPIARYSLSAKAKQAAAAMRGSDHA